LCHKDYKPNEQNFFGNLRNSLVEFRLIISFLSEIRVGCIR